MLHRYHCGKGKSIKYGRKGPHFGLEIEFMPNPNPIALRGYKNGLCERPARMAAYLEQVLLETGFPQRLFLFETDGSLYFNGQHGVELIFKPMSYKVFRSLPWVAFYQRLNTENQLNLMSEKAGMHIHLDAEGRRSKQSNYNLLWFDLLNMPESYRLKLFGRVSNDYCHGVENPLTYEYEAEYFDYTDEYGEDVYHTETECREYFLDRSMAKTGSASFYRLHEAMTYERYVPLNVTNTSTTELRVFASPYNGKQVIAAVDFAAKVILPGFEQRLSLRKNYDESEFYAALLSQTQLGTQGWDEF